MKLTIVTGLTTSGKTTYCKNKDLPYISFDNLFNYQTSFFDFDSFREQVSMFSSDVLLDAYMFNLDPDLAQLRSHLPSNTEIDIVFLYMDPEDYFEAIRHRQLTENVMFCPPPEKLNYETVWNKAKDTIYGILDSVKRTGCPVTYIKRTGTIEYEVKPDEAKLLFTLKEDTKHRLLRFIDDTSGDPKYQTIILNNQLVRNGNEKCWISWDNIMGTGITFQGKSVCDLGCFNGYFSFQMERNGASKVHGYDNNKPALAICKRIAMYDDSKCQFYEKTVGSDSLFNQKYDVVVTLNMLHHVKRVLGNDAYIQALNDIFDNCKEAIFEINHPEINMVQSIAVQKRFRNAAMTESHRITSFGKRYILYFAKTE